MDPELQRLFDDEQDLARLRTRVRALEEYLYDLDLAGGLGFNRHKQIRELIGVERVADMAAERARQEVLRRG